MSNRSNNFNFLILATNQQTDPKAPTLEYLIYKDKKAAERAFQWLDGYISDNPFLVHMNSKGWLHVKFVDNGIVFSCQPSAFVLCAKQYPDYTLWPAEPLEGNI